MQLFLTFAQTTSSETEDRPDVWPSLKGEERNATLEILARLLTKTVLNPAIKLTIPTKEISDE